MGTISKRGESTDDEGAPSEISSTNSPEGFIHDNSRLNRAEKLAAGFTRQRIQGSK